MSKTPLVETRMTLANFDMRDILLLVKIVNGGHLAADPKLLGMLRDGLGYSAL